MARFARRIAPGTLVHVVSRFCNREHRLENEPALRAEYLERIGYYMGRTDWTWLSYGLMDNHTHNGVIAGLSPLRVWVHPLNTWLAGAINRVQNRTGPVFEGRPYPVDMALGWARRLIPYIHNNPCRADVFDDAVDAEPMWTSHQAYLGLVKPPAGLEVELGLELCGFKASIDERVAFDELVRSRREDPRDPELSDAQARRARAEIRRACGAPVEVSTATLTDEGPIRQVVARGCIPMLDKLAVSPEAVLASVREETGIPVHTLTSCKRARRISNARRLALLVWQRLGKPITEMCSALRLGSSAGSNLIYRFPQKNVELEESVQRILRTCDTRKDWPK